MTTIHRYFGGIFFIGLALSIAIPFIFYKGFNSVKYVQVPEANSGLDGLIYHLDECRVANNRIFVRGWASPVSGYGQNLVYAKTDKGSLSVRTSVQDRTDVSAVMSKPGLYDKSGYIASLKLPEGINVSSVMIVTKTGSKVYAVEGNCGQ